MHICINNCKSNATDYGRHYRYVAVAGAEQSRAEPAEVVPWRSVKRWRQDMFLLWCERLTLSSSPPTRVRKMIITSQTPSTLHISAESVKCFLQYIFISANVCISGSLSALQCWWLIYTFSPFDTLIRIEGCNIIAGVTCSAAPKHGASATNE